MPQLEPEIGEPFTLHGIRVKAVIPERYIAYCDGCLFESIEECCSDVKCMGYQREDNLCVIFVKQQEGINEQ
jgi:hypothetical protein